MPRQAPPHIVRVREREAKALELRKAGATYEAMAPALQCSVSEAHRSVKRGLARLAARGMEDAEALRQLELARLDQALVALAPSITSVPDPPNVPAILAWVRVSESRRKLLGLDAPDSVRWTGDLTVTALMAQLQAMPDDELQALRRLLRSRPVAAVTGADPIEAAPASEPDASTARAREDGAS